MSQRRLRFLFIQPEFPWHYVPFFPVYEPLHGLLLGAIVSDIAETYLFDRRFDSDKRLEQVVRDFAPDVVGLTTHVAGEVLAVKRLCRLVKRERPSALTIVGGQHATLLPEDLQDPTVDAICIGPGEETFREVMEAVASGNPHQEVSGLAVNAGDHYRLTPVRHLCSGNNISWPLFDRSLLDRYRKQYFNCFERRTTVYTITSSGCPHRCTFCALWAASRGTYRRRSAQEIAREIASQPQPFVHITDDNTFAHEEHALELCAELERLNVRKKILAYSRTDTIVNKPHLFERWRAVGLGALVVGMEAASDSHLDALNKRTDLQTNIKAHRILDELGIENWAHFVIGPDFERQDFEEVWDFVDEQNITYPVFVPMTPIPGTPLFFQMKEQQKLTSFDYGFYNMQYMVTETRIPKAEWYRHFRGLYARSCSPITLARRLRTKSFHWRPALGRAWEMGRCMRRIGTNMGRQLEHERSFNYKVEERNLLPSLRSDYQPNKYYNAPTLSAFRSAARGEEVLGGRIAS
ncbi:MAG: cobalamin-dependent protein [Deltaproteobacteria bacterium]|nr:cobalamin-dependent protein [Deltaproteobacteria bacterium]